MWSIQGEGSSEKKQIFLSWFNGSDTLGLLWARCLDVSGGRNLRLRQSIGSWTWIMRLMQPRVIRAQATMTHKKAQTCQVWLPVLAKSETKALIKEGWIITGQGPLQFRSCKVRDKKHFQWLTGLCWDPKLLPSLYLQTQQRGIPESQNCRQ